MHSIGQNVTADRTEYDEQYAGKLSGLFVKLMIVISKKVYL